jgi:hypothetical protein
VPSSRRTLGIAVAVIAVALSVVGVSLAATDPNPTGASDSSLALHGQPPRTAQVSIEVDTGQGIAVTGIAGIDFRRQRAEMAVSIPAFVSELVVTVVIASDHVYLTTQNLQSVLRRPWVAVAYPTPDFASLAQTVADFRPHRLELAKLGPLLISHHGPYTTYRATRAGTVTLPGAKGGARTGTVTVAVTTASQDQVSSVSVAARSGADTASAHLDVLAYNAPVHVAVPPRRLVEELPPSVTAGLISGRISFLELLSPDGIAQLRQLANA